MSPEKSAPMPPFKSTRKCPKCNNTEIHTSYHEEKPFSFTCSWGDTAHESKEHMHRTCQRCHYDWVEAPLDAARQTA